MVRAKKDKVCLVHENIGREWGNRRITRTVQAYMQRTEKLDLLVKKELKLLEVAIDGMQETKWFGMMYGYLADTHYCTLVEHCQMRPVPK